MYLLLFLSIIFASANSVVLHKVKLDGSKIYKYNLIGTLVWCICLFVANRFTLTLNSDVILWGVIYGVTQALFILFKTQAMNTGSVSVTTLIGNCSLVVSVLACFILWGEGVGIPDVLGLSVLIVGIFLTTFKKTTESYNRKWLIYSALFFVCAAGVGLTFKAFSKSASPEMAGDMMLFSSIVMLISYTIICLFTGGFKSEKEKNVNKDSKDEQKLFIIYALCSGFLSCVYNRLNIFLAGELPGVVFYPSFNGGVVFLSMTLSILLLREKLSRKQIVGIAIGIIGICIIGVF